MQKIILYTHLHRFATIYTEVNQVLENQNHDYYGITETNQLCFRKPEVFQYTKEIFLTNGLTITDHAHGNIVVYCFQLFVVLANLSCHGCYGGSKRITPPAILRVWYREVGDREWIEMAGYSASSPETNSLIFSITRLKFVHHHENLYYKIQILSFSGYAGGIYICL